MSIDKKAEELANQILVKEAVHAAVAATFKKESASNPYASALVGSLLGAGGGGLIEYLRSDKDDDDKRKKALKGALIGAVAGGGVGYGVGKLRGKGGDDATKTEAPEQTATDSPTESAAVTTEATEDEITEALKQLGVDTSEAVPGAKVERLKAKATDMANEHVGSPIAGAITKATDPMRNVNVVNPVTTTLAGAPLLAGIASDSASLLGKDIDAPLRSLGEKLKTKNTLTDIRKGRLAGIDELERSVKAVTGRGSRQDILNKVKNIDMAGDTYKHNLKHTAKGRDFTPLGTPYKVPWTGKGGRIDAIKKLMSPSKRYADVSKSYITKDVLKEMGRKAPAKAVKPGSGTLRGGKATAAMTAALLASGGMKALNAGARGHIDWQGTPLK